MRKHFVITRAISEIPIYWLILIGVSVYIITITFYAAIYFHYGMVVTAKNGSHVGFIDTLYFSVVTQSTLGYGDLLPASTIARLVVISQVLVGILELSILAGYFLARFFWPANVVRLSKNVAFLPKHGIFKVRAVNMNSFELSRIEIGLWKNVRVENGYSNMPITLTYKSILCMSPMSPWKFKSEPLLEDEIKNIFTNTTRLYFQLSGSFTHSSYVRTKIYHNHSIMCGDFSPVKLPGDPLGEYRNFDWSRFDSINPISIETCLKCAYIKECTCVNKATRSNNSR